MSENKLFEELFIIQSNENELEKKTKERNEISIIIISDIHEKWSYLEKLKEWQIANKLLFDYLICPGDILSLSEEDQSNNTIIFQGEGEISSILSYLESICLNVLYIPGNHEPHTLFNYLKSPELTVRSVNLHQKFFELEKGLYIYGFGGSVSSPISDFKDNIYEKIQFDKSYFTGYPYNENFEEGDSKYYDMFIKSYDIGKKNIEAENKEINQILLLSHIGPFYSPTTILQNDLNNGLNIYMGSKQLNKFISNNDRVFLNIHGHTHDGDGLSKLGKTNIFNPGSLTKGNFGMIKLKKDYKNIWKCEKIEIINLDF